MNKETKICKICNNFEYTRDNLLGLHVKIYHKDTSYTDYIIKYYFNGINPVCLNCKIKLPHIRGGFRKFCSKSCGSSGMHNSMYGRKGENSPILGIKRTPEQLENYGIGANKRWELHGVQLREMMKTTEYREAQSQANFKKYEDDPNLKNRIAASVHAFWDENPKAESLRQAAALRAIDMSEKGIIGPQAPFKTEWVYNPFTKQKEYLHSSWEKLFLENCIKINFPITKKHDLRIPYTDNENKNKIYVPDFIALNKKIVFEIKGLYRASDMTKIDALRLWCKLHGYSFVVLDTIEKIEEYSC